MMRLFCFQFPPTCSFYSRGIFGEKIGIKLVCRQCAFHNRVIPVGIKQDWCSYGDKVNSQQGGWARQGSWDTHLVAFFVRIRVSQETLAHLCFCTLFEVFYLQILPLRGLSRLQHEKLVAVQMATSSIMSAWYDPSGITAPIPQQRSTPRRAPAQMANSQNGENILPHGNAPPPCRRPSDPWPKWKTRLKFSASTTCVGLPNNRVCLDFCPGRGPGPI